MAETNGHGDLRERPVNELLKELSEQTGTLVRQELELARLELTEKGKRAGIGLGMFSGTGVFSLMALGALTACFILALDMAMAGWLAALIVAVAYAAIAGLLALTGKKQIERATPPIPEQATESMKEDIEWTKQRAKSRA
jgi:uncharacterized membrane protein YqjE